MSKFFTRTPGVQTIPKKHKLTPEQKQKHILTESQLKSILTGKKKVLLIEPEYKRTHVPLGLAKISSFIKSKGGSTVFSRTPISGDFDCVCITSLFTYDSLEVLDAINKTKRKLKSVPIIVGGIFASMMPEYITEKTGTGVFIFIGCAEFLDKEIPDYDIDWGVEERLKDVSYVFTTRGCANSCAYCVVRKIEPELKLLPNWKEQILSGKSKISIRDNNLSSQPKEHLYSVLDFLAETGKPMEFNSGFDCKYITDELVQKLVKLDFSDKTLRRGMRLAFDRIEEDGIFQSAVEKLLAAGINNNNILAYVLFNFTDTPKEANYRMTECTRLGIKPYPQRYAPLNVIHRLPKHVGKYWSDNLAVAFRNFWLMQGLTRGSDFGKYLESKEAKRYKITPADIELFYFEKEKK